MHASPTTRRVLTITGWQDVPLEPPTENTAWREGYEATGNARCPYDTPALAGAWIRGHAAGVIARAWREGAEFGHDVAAVWAEAV